MKNLLTCAEAFTIYGALLSFSSFPLMKDTPPLSGKMFVGFMIWFVGFTIIRFSIDYRICNPRPVRA
jgi:hypothetical protein